MANPQSVYDMPDPLAGDSGSNWTRWANQNDPTGSRLSSDQTWFPQDTISYGFQPHSGFNYDPTVTGETFDTMSTLFGAQSIGGGIDDWMKQKYPQLYSFSNTGQTTNPGQVGKFGGDKAGVDAWDDKIKSTVIAVQKETNVYVPPNVVKAIMAIESGGDPSAGPAYGVLQMTDQTLSGFGQDDLNRMRTDPDFGLYAGIKELALRYKDATAQNKDYTWSNVASGFFSGHYQPDGSADSLGTTDYGYVKSFNDYWNQLNGSTSSGTTAAPNTRTFNSIWGGYDAPITQEYGNTDFSASAGSYYDYGAAYTRDGKPMGHPGVDVGVAYGTPLYSPVAGVVELVGISPDGNYYYCDRDVNGCGDGRGELTIRYPSGDQLILGHMSQIKVKVGDTITPGEFVGYSGAENGNHVHVEYRKWVGDGVTSSGWEVQDPRSALSGIFTGTYGTAGSSGPTFATSPDNWNAFMRAGSLGQPLKSGPATVGGFHDWLINTMGVGTAPTVSSDVNGDPARWLYGTIPTNPASGSNPH